MITADKVLLEAQSGQLEILKELKQFIVDICFDYTCKDPDCSANVGLSAIRVLCKGKQSEEEFKKVWEQWREKHMPQTQAQSRFADRPPRGPAEWD